MNRKEKVDEYIIDESQEISLGEAESWTSGFFKIFPALSSKNYQVYFAGQFVSLAGTWLQIVAQGWLVLEITKSAFMVGLVATISSLPALFFTLFAGVIIDRLDRKKILYFTQFASAVIAIFMGILTVNHQINMVSLTILAGLMGLISALDIPARQAFSAEMVERELLSSAIALNSGIFNLARVIGPALAGFLIAFFGTGGAFIINGISFFAVVISLFFMDVKTRLPKTYPHPLKAIHEGLIYSFSNKKIRNLLLLTGVAAIFGWSYTTIMPVVAKQVFHMDVTGLGYLNAAAGTGAFLGAVVISAFSKKFSSMFFIFSGNILFAISLILFSLTQNINLAYLLLFISGFGLILQFSTINSALQHLVNDEVRGRVMSIYTLMFLGLTPFGSFEIGLIAEHIGAQYAIGLGAFVVLIGGIIFYFNERLDKEILKS